MEQLVLEPIAHVSGEVTIPGSKSLSNRALLIAALSEGTTKLTNLLDSDDVRYMLNALAQLGVNYSLSDDKTECTIEGLGSGFVSSAPLELFLGNAGTAMRPLCAALALSQGEFTLTGDPRMYERPIAHLVDALKQAGLQIDYLGNPGFPPLKIKGVQPTTSEIEVDGSVSSQFLTALLVAGPLFNQDLEIKMIGELVSKPYIDITLAIMHTFGVEVENYDYQRFVIKKGQKYRSPGDYMIEGDASSASYFLAAAAIKGGTVRVNGVGLASTQGDTKFADVLEKMGAKVTWGDTYIEVTRRDLNGVDLDLNHIPDAAMTIATTALFATGPTVIRNVYNWRVKETDRLAAMATELRKVGAEVEEGNDYIAITPPNGLTSAQIDTYDDHRMAMCFSLAAMGDAVITINDPRCTDKTFPTYFSEFKAICQ